MFSIRFMIVTAFAAVVALVVLGLLIWIPESFFVTRIVMLVCVGVILLSVAVFLSIVKILAICYLVLIGLLIGTVFIPGNPQPSRETYVRRLRACEGVSYVWGGENWRGLDCSGLLRQGYMQACLFDAVQNLDPRLLRKGFDVWLWDASAKELLSGYDSRTIDQGIEGTINSLHENHLQIGDMAITKDGVHCLAYLGKSEWVSADPALGRVVITKAPDRDFSWFSSTIRVVRWQALRPEQTNNPSGNK